jgi:hypothetical protein
VYEVVGVRPLTEILDDVERFVARYVVLSHHQLVAIVLWVALTYAVESAEVAAYLAITSPERRTGKTRLLEVLGVVVHDPIVTTNITPSALFRAVDASSVTVLFDEADTVFGRRDGNEDLRALLNAGFARGGQVHRSEAEGKKYVLRSFNVFGPKALAAIGALPDTISDRSIHIRMKRKTPDESVERFRRRLVRDEAERLRSELAGWAVGAIQGLAAAWPALPNDLDDRAADAWEPLLAIADEARHGWDSRARAAALALAEDKETEETARVLLLGHLRDIFGDRDRMTTVGLLGELVDREDGPWGKWWGDAVEVGRTKGPASRLAKLLKGFGIKPKKMREGEETFRGYERSDFVEAWSRYLPPIHPPENTEHGTRNTETPSEQSVPLFHLAGGVAQSSVPLGNPGMNGGSCPECGQKWFQGHAENCLRRTPARGPDA